MLDVSFLNYILYVLAHAEILKCKLTNFSVSIHATDLLCSFTTVFFPQQEQLGNR